MVELFLVNYTHTRSANCNYHEEWTCHKSTHSLAVATEVAQELRTLGYRVNVQSVLLNENGKVSI